MSQDPYELLGVPRDADADTIKKAYRRSRGSCTPTSTPTRRRRTASRTSRRPTRCSRTRRSARRSTGAATPFMGGFGGQGAGFSFTDIMDAFFGGAAGGTGSGPRTAATRTSRPGCAGPPRGRAGRGGLRRHPRAQGRHRRGLHDLPRRGHRAGHPPGAVRDLPWRGRGGARPALVPRRDPHPAAVRGLPRLRRDHPRALPGVLRRRPRALATQPEREDPGRRRQRHPRAALAARARSAPAAGLRATSTSRSASPRTTTFTRHGSDLHCTVSLPMTAAALGTTLTLPTLEADIDQGAGSGLETQFELEVKPGTQSGTERVLRGRGVPGLRGGRGDLVVTIVVDTPTRLDRTAGGAPARAGRDPGRGVARRRHARLAEVGVQPLPRRVQPALILSVTRP